MAVGLLLLYLNGLVFCEEPPDVNCLVVNLDYVHCMWKGSATPDVTFYSRFGEVFNECARYVLENTTIVGCDHPYEGLLVQRSSIFFTKLVLGNSSFVKRHTLQSKVKLNAPINLTVKMGADSNLWYYWNYTYNDHCIVSQVRHRIKEKEWNPKQPLIQNENKYCINLPSSGYRYELQVRSTISDICGKSDFWSDWSSPVFWGSTSEISTGTGDSMAVWTPVLWALAGSFIFVLLVTVLVQHERLKVIVIPILPDPGKNLAKILADPGNVEDWLPISKSIKEGFKANYSERACSVREYSRISQSASESSVDQSSSDQSSGSCASSIATDQTNCSVSLQMNEPAGPTASTSTIPVSSVERHRAG